MIMIMIILVVIILTILATTMIIIMKFIIKNNLKEKLFKFLCSYKDNMLFTIIVERVMALKKKNLALKINVFLYFYVTY